MSTYLAYDLKGLHSFIFAVPRLRYVIGGSALIDNFDRDFAPRQRGPQADLVFSGGGKGCFRCTDRASADRLQDTLRREAHRVGLDIAFSCDAVFAMAIDDPSERYPCLPDMNNLDGHPCAATGDWPVADATTISALANRRCYDRGNRPMRRYEDELIGRLSLPPKLQQLITTTLPASASAGDSVSFFHNVDPENHHPDAADPAADLRAGLAGAAALGDRNRWAVIYMDGNDMGTQFAAAAEQLNEEQLIEWVGKMAPALDDCCRSACCYGIDQVLWDWVEAVGIDEIKEHCLADGTVVLPVRPLVVGGDDLIILCHSAHAFTLVEEISYAFAEASRKHPDLWLGTSGELSMSAGILFCGTSMPLAGAVAYAGQLLSLAKRHGRTHQQKGHAAPACLDWEIVTESVIDTPQARRQRTLTFQDGDIGQTVLLTRKPYQIDEDLPELRKAATAGKYRDLPRGISHKLRDILGHAFWERRLDVNRLAKQQGPLSADLDEGDDKDKPLGRWKVVGNVRSIDVLDIVEMIEEGLRLKRPTVTQGG